MGIILFFFVSFAASLVGSICGIGGGVIIKPVMDAAGIYPADTVSFMSGCIVLAMSGYSVVKGSLAHEAVIQKGVSTYLGIGAALGGIAGKRLLDMTVAQFSNADTAGAIQAAALFAVVLATTAYTIWNRKLSARQLKHPLICSAAGLLMGLLSAFLGIGGGPINLVVLRHFFSMETKTAAQNSLYVIFISQIASLLFTIGTGTVPEVPVLQLLWMMGGGILGGVAGRAMNRHMDSRAVNGLFLSLQIVIMGICVANFLRFCKP